MMFMVIERFKDQDGVPVYKFVRDHGIEFPDERVHLNKSPEGKIGCEIRSNGAGLEIAIADDEVG